MKFSTIIKFPLRLHTIINIILFLSVSFSSFSQNSRGTDFWMGFMEHIDKNNTKVLMITSRVNTSGTVSVPLKSWTKNFSVTANSIAFISLPDSAETIGSESTSKTGIHIVANDTIMVYAHQYYSARSEAALILPTSAIRNKYYVMTYEGYSQGTTHWPSEFLIVAVSDSTNINITPTEKTLGGVAANNTFSVLLNTGEAYQVQALLGATNDMTGSYISGNKNFALFAGNKWTRVNNSCATQDNLFEQMYPLSSWGREYISVRTQGRKNPYDIIRIISSLDSTDIYVDGVLDTTLNAGAFYEWDNYKDVTYINANNPILVAQFITGQGCGGSNMVGDPSMILLNPIDQSIDEVTFYSSPFENIDSSHINITTRTVDTASVLFDSKNVSAYGSAFKTVSANNKFSYVHLRIDTGVHRITSTGCGVIAMVYGYGNIESYGYSAGASFKDINIQIDANVVIIGTSYATCKNDTISFSAVSTDSIMSYLWVFGDGDSSTASNSSHVYPNTGTYKVTLMTEVMNNCGTLDTVYSSSDVIISKVNSINFTVNNVSCYGQTDATAKATAVGGVGTYTYLWNDTSNQTTQTATGLNAGMYSVTITDQAGCSLNDSVEVKEPSPFIISAVSKGVFCEKEGKASVTVISGTAPYTYLWSDTLKQMDSVATGLSTGIYTVWVTDADSCIQSDTVSIVSLPIPNANAGNNIEICLGNSTQLNASGGILYNWASSNTLSDTTISNPIASPIVATTYFVTVTDSSGCKNNDSVTVTLSALPTVDAGNDTAICIGNSIQLNATGATTYSWSPSTGLSDTTISNPIATPLNTITYYLTTTDSNTCNSTDSITITVNPLPVVDAGNDTALCIGDSTQLNASGGIIYSWSPSTNLSDTTIYNPYAAPSVTTTYRANVTDINSCSNSDTVIITVNGLPLVDAGNNVVICIYDSVQLNATNIASYSYNWSPSSGLSSTTIYNPFAFPTATSNYYLTVTDTNNCINNDSLTVTVNPLPIVDAGKDTTICFDDTIPLNATGGIIYNWSPSTGLSDTSVANPLAFPLIATTYYVSVTDTNGCTNSDSVIISVNSLPIVDAGKDTSICFGDSTQLNASGGIFYSWSPSIGLSDTSIANPYVRPFITSNYYVTAVDANTCVNNDSLTITIYALPIVDAGNDTSICFGDTAQLDATGGVSFLWTLSASLSEDTIFNPTAFPTDTTTYHVTVTDTNRCSNADSVVVSIIIPFIDAGADLWLCPGDSLMIVTTADSGVSYSWTPGSYLSDSTIANPMSSPPLNTTYIVTVVDSNSCINSDTLTVNVNAVVPTDPGNNRAICIGDSTTLGGTPTSPNGSTYLWVPSLGLSGDTVSNPIAFPIVNTVYNLYTTNDTCVGSGTVAIVVNPLPIVDAGVDAQFCENDSTQLNATGGVQFVWSPSLGLNDTAIANPYASPLDTTTYYVIVTDTNNCSDIDSVTITFNPLPPADAGLNTQICDGDSTQLNASGGIAFKWTPVIGLSDTAIANPYAKPSDTTTYYISVTDTNGCMDIDSVTITFNPLPVLDAGSNVQICIGDSTQLNAIGPPLSIFSWSPSTRLSNTSIANPHASPLDTMTYYLTVTDTNACVNSDAVIVIVNPLPPADAGADVQFCEGDSIQLNASGGILYTWTPANGLNNTAIPNPFAFPADTTLYYVTVTDSNGCINVDSVTVTFNPLPIVNAGNDVQICKGDSTSLAATAPPLSTFAWNPSAGLSNTSISNPKASPLATQQYKVVVTDTNSCSDVDSLIVTIYSLPVADAGKDTAICLGDSAFLNAKGGTAYHWSTGMYLNDTSIANPIATPPLTTVFTLTVTDNNNCSDVDAVKITVLSLPVANAGSDEAICIGESVQLLAKGGLYYLWTPALGLSDTTVANPVANPSVSSTYYLVVTDNNTCVNYDTLSITVYPLPIVDAGEDTIACLNVPISIGGAPTGPDSSSYSWLPNQWIDNTSLANPNVSPKVKTTYYVSVTDSNGCITSDSILVNVFYLVNGTDTSICKGDSSQLLSYTVSGRAPIGFQWSPTVGLNNANIGVPNASPDETTTYTLVATDANGCVDSTTYLVQLLAMPSALFEMNITPSCEEIGTEILNLSTDATSYRWVFNDGTTSTAMQPDHALEYGQTYSVKLIATNLSGCSDSLIVSDNLQSFSSFFEVDMPNVFTPNFDGVNDLFTPKLNNMALSGCIDLKIYNRWGSLMFISSAGSYSWDGHTDEGLDAPDGTYFYVMTIKDFQFQGSVNLVR